MTDSSNIKRRDVLIGLGTAATVSLAGCSTGTGGGAAPTEVGMGTPTATESPTPTPTPTEIETTTPTGTATLRVAHVSPNAPDVDVYVDGTAVLEDVGFGAVSDYLEVSAGSHRVRITPAGDADTTVFEGDVSVAADTAYTVAAIGEIGDMADQSFEPLILEDDNSDPGEDMARVRVVHASPDAPAVDVTVTATGDALFDGVAYGEWGYVTVPAGEYTVEVRGDTANNDGDVVAAFDLNLAGGQVYTAFAAGYLTPDDEPADTPFDLLVSQDTDDEMIEETANLRVAHVSPNAPDVDVYVDGTAVLEDVGFGAVSDYVGVTGGAHRVQITAAGDPDTVVFDDEVTVVAGTDYTVAAVGELGDMADQTFEVLVLEDDTTAPDEGMAKLRVLHASPDAPAVDVTVASSGDVLYDGVAYGQSGYVTVPAGEYTVEVRGDTMTNDGDVVAAFDLSLAEGQIYTAFAAGYLTPDDEPADASFDLVVTQDTNESR